MKFNLNNRICEIKFGQVKIQKKDYQKSFYIIDANVYKKFPALFRNIPAARKMIFSAFEQEKNLENVKNFYHKLQKSNFNRSHTIYGIGGGITTDLAAFVASTYMRGTELILIPTTLLAMVDAAVGGKTAINFQKIKNNIGTFYPAHQVIIDTKFLSTLPENEIKNGLAELVKIALIKRNKLYEKLIQKKVQINIDIIKSAIKTKLEICQKDLFDKNERRYLNLGHTFAHVLETGSDYQIPHGIAVAYGIKATALYSFKTRWISSEVYDKINKIIDYYDLTEKKYAYLKETDFRAELFLKDKKTDESVNLIMFNGFQSVFFKKITKIHLLKKVLVQVLNEA